MSNHESSFLNRSLRVLFRSEKSGKVGLLAMADGGNLRGYNPFGEKTAKEDKRPRPRIAFAGEEYGFGYQALSQFVSQARNRRVYDGGIKAVGQDLDQEFRDRKAFDDFNFEKEQRQPLRTKEQALMAVKSGTADYAVVPFYNPYFGYDYETLRALQTLSGILAVEQYEATDNMCLAVHESQVLELAQSAHPGSAFSSLLKHERKQWGTHERVRGEKNMDINGQSESHRAGLAIDQSAQLLLRDRLDMVFAGPEAARRCKSKLDGLRAAGVELAETPQTVEPHRELARRARSSLNSTRQINTFFDPRSGEAHYVSSMSADAQQQTKLYGVVLPFQVAMMSSEYVIVDPDMDDSETLKTRFFVAHQNPDKSLFEDAFRTTDAKTRYWETRMKNVSWQSNPKTGGVRVMLRFLRSETAASVGDVENYLRNYGVSFNTVRLDEDSGSKNPAAIVMDIEFSNEHGDFRWIPFSRRLRGSVVNGALKKAFQRWKNRGVLVLAAVPYDEPQLARQKPRRWWKEAFIAQQKDFVETMFIRLSRVLFKYVIPLSALAILAAIGARLAGLL